MANRLSSTNELVISGVASTLQRAARIITMLPIEVRIETELGYSTPVTNGTMIYLPAGLVKDALWPKDRRLAQHVRHYGERAKANAVNVRRMDKHGLATVVGGLYHEIGHILYTPFGTNAVQRKLVNSSLLFRAWNILEDQRTERLFTSVYPGAAPWISSVVVNWALNDLSDKNLLSDENFGGAYPYISHRKHVPVKLRRATRKACRFDVDAIDVIVAEYLTLVLPRDNDRAEALTKDLANIIFAAKEFTNGESYQPDGPNHDMTNDTYTKAQSDEESAEQQRRAQEAADDEDEEDSGSEETIGASADGASPDDEGDDEPGDDEVADSSSDARGDSVGDDLASVLDAMQDALEATVEDIADDIRAISDQVVETVDSGVCMPRPNRSYTPTESAARVGAKRISQALREIRGDAAPGWERRTRTGRLDVRRYATRKPGDVDLFDRRTPDLRQDTDAEIVLLIDTSGSMCGHADTLTQALWVLKSAMDEADVRCHVAEFNSYTSIVYGPDDKARKTHAVQIVPNGGTHPVTGLDWARRILTSSHAAHKGLVILTDGEWASVTESDALIASMNDVGITTTLIGLRDAHTEPGYLLERHGHHSCTHAVDATDVSSIVAVTRKLISAWWRNDRRRSS